MYIPKDSPSWNPQWPKPESAVSSNMPVYKEYTGYNPEGEGSVCVLFVMVIDSFA